MAQERPPLGELLEHWQTAGLISADQAHAIEAWEQQKGQPAAGRGLGLQLPVRLVVALGAFLLAAGLLLFVSAHWGAMAAGWRFSLLLAVLLGLHGTAAAVAEGFPVMAVALHGTGSLVLGAAIFLSGQIFHLEAHWPAGLLLWAVGAGLGWWLLRQWPQLALLTLLLPSWLASEWLSYGEEQLQLSETARVAPLAAGLLLLALAGFTAPAAGKTTTPRRVLLWLGGLTLLPGAQGWVLMPATWPPLASLPAWAMAGAGPLLLSWRLHGRRAWPMALVPVWMVLEISLRQAGLPPLIYAWWGIGGAGLVGWGLMERRLERINIGMAVLAITLLAFYVTDVMTRIERSLSLVLLGLLFLGGGWALERLRRRLVTHALRSAS